MIEWNHDMSAAPRGELRTEIRKIGKDEKTVDVFHKEYILAVDRYGTVYQTAYIPPTYTKSGGLLEGDRWSGFSRDFPPIAWAPWPTYGGVKSDEDGEEFKNMIEAITDELCV